ncbi:DUF397 domain-containing protein [Actinomadura rugatobispora]|uniref:DUF397 domain-containing protein n=1 Tax=Actinomadura rugatobispora TaxID=1994 RepID=A0ABW1A8K7_9ACTN
MKSAPHWRKSSRSAGAGESECVEPADLGLGVGVRDSRDPDGPRLILRRDVFADVVAGIRAGRLTGQRVRTSR